MGVFVLGIHLCGVLSIRAVQFFNDNPRCTFLALKPCCLPPLSLAKQKYVWTIGGHTIDAKDVCAKGKYNKGKWIGPPKAHLRATFQCWMSNLSDSIVEGESGSKETADIKIVHTAEGDD